MIAANGKGIPPKRLKPVTSRNSTGSGRQARRQWQHKEAFSRRPGFDSPLPHEVSLTN